PELRFPGFEGEWEEMPLEKLCTFSNGINAKKEQYGHGRKFINVLDILNKNYITYDEIIGAVSVSEETEQRNKVEYGDLLFLRSSETREEVGTSNVYLDDRFALYGGFVIRGKKIAEYDPMFIKNLLNTGKIRSVISAASGGSTRYNVNQEILKKLKLKLTKIKEQQKIGNFFSKLDRQIELEEQKLALLEEQKKGYMQKIFSQELRFKDDDDNDYPAWEERLIKEIVQFENSRRKPITSSIRESGVFPYYGASGIIDYVKEYIFDGEIRLLVGEDGAKWGAFENSSFIAMGKYWVNNHVHVIKSESANLKFLNYLLNYKELRTFVTGNAPPKLTYNNLCQINLLLPTYEEQEKIGDFFSKLDQQIELQEQKIENLKQRKKGLLQKMFV
ncbi:restriction endonuclease subunit S, partial [Staphylococcus delphini]|uniref:restriction endonuclease subunit S n=1 Tax=Staphylococcus delphini TaxID=53344 RepID=UPI001CCFC001